MPVKFRSSADAIRSRIETIFQGSALVERLITGVTEKAAG
jgi:ABC-type uncharacterized transport system ATPase subunit